MKLEVEKEELLKRSWVWLVGSIQLDTDELYKELRDRYAEPHRHYHDINHVAQVLNVLEEMGAQEKELYWAAWFHDVVYEPERRDNEERSADLAREKLSTLTVPAVSIDNVLSLILATDGHKAESAMAGQFLDADLSVLAEEEGEYKSYTEKIRKEYSALGDEYFIEGRKKFVENLLARDFVFLSDYFRQKFENKARSNLMRELEYLNADRLYSLSHLSS